MLTESASRVARRACVQRAAACAFAVVLVAAAAAPAHADDIARTGGPYVPTPQEVVDSMLELAQVGPRDLVMDLGSGDGRMVLTAARRYGARGVGVDLDPELVERSAEEAQRDGLADRVRFRVEDVTRTPLAEASVVTLYLLPGLMRALQPRFLAELAPGTRIVSHDFDLGDWKPERQVTLDVKEKYGSPGSWKSTLFLWTVPARLAGAWQVGTAGAHAERMVLRLAQRYQEISGSAVLDGRSYSVIGGRVHGSRVEFTLGPEGGPPALAFAGTVEGDAMNGTMARAGVQVDWSATRLTTEPPTPPQPAHPW
jgi:SAM-dependent methyltransferase